ncbi:MAG: hypothetical protein WCC69_12310 [Pirellulales bacterium]
MAFPSSLNGGSVGIPLTLIHPEANRCTVMGYVPWNFAIRSEAAVQTDPFEEEFFIGPSDSELDDGHVASLVRESVQNALDARVGADPVRVTFALHESRVRQAGVLRYLAGLEPHLAALTPPVAWPLDGANDTIRWLVYEDFHTTGLCGDPSIVDDPPAGHERREDFYWFWRNVGRSAKTGEKLGRWGLGKTVFPSSSNINCIIGLTRRSDDNRLLIMGQAVLRNHTIRGKRYLPYGLLSDPDADGKTPMPFEGDEAAAEVVRAFRLRRNGETGLSLVVPFVRDGITADAIARSVCIHFFVRILRGELVVETMDERGGRYEITAATIDDVVRQLRWELPDGQRRVSPPPLDLARLALERLASGAVDATLPPAGASGTAAWTRDVLPKAIAEPLAKALSADSGHVLVKVPLVLERASGERVETHFHVALRRRPDGKGEGWYVRDGMTITAVNRKRPSSGDYEGLLLASDPVISGFLGDAEGPAHVEWSKEEKRLARNWRTFTRRIGFVTNGIVYLADMLRENQPKTAPLALAKVFSVRLPAKPEGPASPTIDRPEEIPSRQDWYTIGPKGHGFSIRSVPNAPRPPVHNLRVTFAYDVSSGDPFRIWSPYDFELRLGQASTLKIKGTGLKAKLLTGNAVLLTDLEETFSFSVEGFDAARDVVVRADVDAPVDEPEAVEA